MNEYSENGDPFHEAQKTKPTTNPPYFHQRKVKNGGKIQSLAAIHVRVGLQELGSGFKNSFSATPP